MKKLMLVISLMLSISLGLSQNFVYAKENVPSTQWLDYAAPDFGGGSGTKEDPYLIENGEQLAKLAKDVNSSNTYQGEYFRLENDLNLSEHRWNPIGKYIFYSNYNSVSKPFCGYFDGNNKTITGLTVDESDDQGSAGLFGYVNHTKGKNEVGIGNLTISNASVYMEEKDNLMECYGAILLGYALTNAGYTITFDNIKVSGKVEMIPSSGSTIAGGLIASAARVKGTNCESEVTITGCSNGGGLIGIDSGSEFINCQTSGSIEGTWSLGGFVGYATSSTYNDASTGAKYEKCISNVKVNGNDWRLGGFAGYSEYGNFDSCAALGNVTSSVTEFNPKVGGFIGESFYSTLNKCHASNVIKISAKDYQGGTFIGTFDGESINDSSADLEKNPNLSTVNENNSTVSLTGIENLSTNEVLKNICEDIHEGHKESEEWTYDKEATCLENGVKTLRCVRCSTVIEQQQIEKLGHQFDNDWLSDENYHWVKCTNNGCEEISKKEKHYSTKKATEEDAEVCDQCGYVMKPALGHVHKLHLIKVAAKKATYDENGNKEYYQCSCGKLYADKLAQKEVKMKDVLIKKLTKEDNNNKPEEPDTPEKPSDGDKPDTPTKPNDSNQPNQSDNGNDSNKPSKSDKTENVNESKPSITQVQKNDKEEVKTSSQNKVKTGDNTTVFEATSLLLVSLGMLILIKKVKMG